jgi:uncharacterized membrane protein
VAGASTIARAARGTSRLASLDALRGLALLAMVAYHFVFDLNHFGFIHQDFYQDPFWLTARTVILSSFLLLAGMSLALTRVRVDAGHSFWRRLGRIAAAAALVSAASWLVFPQSWIYFGVLHFLALASLIAWPLVRLGPWNAWLGAVCIALGNGPQWPAFASPWINWLGFAPMKPLTEDYVPLIPWLGVVLLGVAAMQARDSALRDWLTDSATRSPRWLSWLGRHSLGFYLLHQPALFGLLELVRRGA